MNQLDLDLQQLFAQPPYRRFLLQIVRLSGITIPTAGAGTDPHFREGQRSLGLEILRLAARGSPRRATAEQMLSLVLASETIPEETDNEATLPDHDRS